MRPNSDTRRRGPLELQAFYSVGALARAGNVSTDLLRHLLRTNGVRMLRGGRALFVALVEIEAKMPVLWRSIQLAERLRQHAG